MPPLAAVPAAFARSPAGHRRGRSGALVAFLLALLLGGQLAPAQATPVSDLPLGASPQALPVLFGAATPDLKALDRLSELVNARVRLFTYYRAWAASPRFDSAYADAVRAHGATPAITWEPWDPARGVSQPAYALRAITGGGYDGYLRAWARGIRAWGHPLVLRFAHEMNGNWYPWAEGVNGNGAGEYVAAWRHVRSIFASEGARNVTWVWSPNISFPSSRPLAELYPGDALVDRVGLDGYNGGAALPWGGWKSFSQLFDPSIGEVRRFTAKPLVIGETASVEAGGSKAAWIRDFFAALKARPNIVAFTWFDYNKEADWRVNSSVSAAAAFRTGVADPRYH